MYTMYKTFIQYLIFVMVTITISGCSLYRADLQQGNYITQVEIDKLQTGQTKAEVQQIMGSTIVNPMFTQEQWNYSFGYIDGKHRDQPIKFKTITLYFKGGELVAYASDYWHPANLPRRKY